MARTGRPPKPTEEKRLLGNPGKRPIAGGAELAIVAPLPVTMADQSPRDAFEKVMQYGVAWLAATDAPTVALLRELLEERGELKALVDGGASSERRALRDLDKQIISLLAQLGFDPASRARLGLAEVRAASKLEGIRASQAKRVAPKVAHEDDAG